MIKILKSDPHNNIFVGEKYTVETINGVEYIRVEDNMKPEGYAELRVKKMLKLKKCERI